MTLFFAARFMINNIFLIIVSRFIRIYRDTSDLPFVSFDHNVLMESTKLHNRCEMIDKFN